MKKVKERTFNNVNMGFDRSNLRSMQNATAIERELNNLGVSYDNEGSDNNTYNINARFALGQGAEYFIKKHELMIDYLETDILESRKVKEAVDSKKIVKDMQGNFGGDNESQMKGLQLLKGLATSDEKIANDFMKELDKAMTTISKKLTKEEAVEEKDKMSKVKEDEEIDAIDKSAAPIVPEPIILDVGEEILLPDTDIILEPGDRIQVFPAGTGDEV